MKLPHWFGYRVFFDDEKNLCLKGRGFYFFYVLGIMLFLCIGLPIAVRADKSANISGTAFLLLLVLVVLGFSTSIRIIFFKPIQRSVTIARNGTVTVRDLMIIGRRSFDIKMDEIDGIAFVSYRARSRTCYCVIVRRKDGSDRSLTEENMMLLENPAKKAMQELRTLLSELHRDSSISVRECSIETYQARLDR